MIQTTYSLRVRYADTDAMKYVYYGNFAEYLEVARVELFRSMGMSYSDIENQGIWLPVSEFKIKYLKPATYDEVLKIQTCLAQKPKAKIKFEYKIFNSKQETIAAAETTLYFFDSNAQKIVRCPDFLMKLIDEHWK